MEFEFVHILLDLVEDDVRSVLERFRLFLDMETAVFVVRHFEDQVVYKIPEIVRIESMWMTFILRLSLDHLLELFDIHEPIENINSVWSQEFFRDQNPIIFFIQAVELHDFGKYVNVFNGILSLIEKCLYVIQKSGNVEI